MVQPDRIKLSASIYQKAGAALRKTVEQRLEPHHVFLIFVSARCFGASGDRDKSSIGVTTSDIGRARRLH